MSKMPAKKKSCFQITSVTQAQVAGSGQPDDTESLDDPDESRTEDISSSEIFDSVSRTELEAGTGERSSSEETLNNVGESEGPPASHKPGLLAPSNGGVGPRELGTLSGGALPGSLHSPGVVGYQGPQGPVQSSQLPQVSQVTQSSSSSTSSGAFSSRFRLIKLDHSTGEPFKRGRWTCTEYYEKDPDVGSSRTVDSIRHTNVSVVSEQGTDRDRDSGLGATIGSVTRPSGLSGQGDEPPALDPSLLHGSLHPFEQHGYGIVPQQVPPGSGTVTSDALGSKQQHQAPAGPGSHVTNVPHSLLPPGHNGLQQGGHHVQKQLGVAPTISQQQTMLYQAQQQQQQQTQQQQLPLGHHLPNQPGLAEYAQQHLPLTVAQTHPGASLSVVHPASQGPSPVPTPAAGGMPVLGVPGDMTGMPVPLPGGQPGPSVSNLLPQLGAGMISGVSAIPTGQSSVQLGQYPPSSMAVPPQNAQTLPAVPTSAGMGGAPVTGGHSPMPASGGVPVPMPNASSSQAQVTRNAAAVGGFGQLEEGRRKSDVLAQVPLMPGKDLGKPLITEDLPLATPGVNSLFGITIPIDGDDDRNPSTVFYRAFQPGSRLRDSKPLGDSASGASVVAIDNKIEQAMDLVKSHLMYAVREEVEVLKEQIKELYERNSVLERENAVLKSLANNDQLSQLSSPASNPSNNPSNPSTNPSNPGSTPSQPLPQFQPEISQAMSPPLQPLPPQPSVTSA
ncbi:TSC22 domain family protein 2 isoform X1 [Astyanax mexicanus]|uniref:TSC22 domain family protein 2 isoform X1 n=1 Tax=Astyanax mexicanus TaxID=7994 RepID=UPI0020CB2815|nr:TSC22 domain family protein 2 isoform X1 [Astyanax mexicanus]